MTTIVLTEKAAYIDRQLTVRSLAGKCYYKRKILSIPEKGLHLFLLGATSFVYTVKDIIAGDLPKVDLTSDYYRNENLRKAFVIGFDDEGHYYSFKIVNTGKELKVTSRLYIVKEMYVHGSGGEYAFGSLLAFPGDYDKAFLTASIMDEHTSAKFDKIVMGNRE